MPDAILPEQYFDRLAARTSDTPERRLLFAVLLDAVIQLQRRNTSGSAEAERWIRNESRSDFPFSFRNVCDALGIEPGYLQRGLLSWRRSQVGTMPGIPVRQLRTSHRRVTPLGRRRRRSSTAVSARSAGAAG
ncbi:MAG: hypothetical protein IT294_12685 [Deltaproteobacteria bacterium]|nr:hypothetical protein [Deltaproteobacteria bacterium]